MVHALARNWWAIALRGAAAIVFGVLAFVWPGATFAAIGILFGAYAFVDGVFAVVAAIRAAEAHERWWLLAIEGFVGLAIGCVTFYDLGITLLAIYYTIAAWAFMTGFLEIMAAINLRKSLTNELWLITGGIASILFGALMIWRPMAGTLAIIWLIGVYAVVFGGTMIGLALRLKAHLDTHAGA